MNIRLAVLQLIALHDLDATRAQRLRQLAGLDAEPAILTHWLPRAVAVLGAALCGLGIVFWIAANWDSLSRLGQFALLQGFLVAASAAALWSPRARLPLGLLVLLGTGGLFAYFGQTYQTGADAWQLFALWAVLTLPLCLALRSDVLWAPWVLVAMAAISLWVFAHLGQRWFARPEHLQIHAVGWITSVLLVAALSKPARHVTGAGSWSLRVLVTLTVVMISCTALVGLFESPVSAHYWIGLIVLALAATLFATRLFDVYALSAIALGLNALLVGGAARALFHAHYGSNVGILLMLGLLAAGLLAATVAGVLRVTRDHAEEAE
jgi:uncharacterized membrane protein